MKDSVDLRGIEGLKNNHAWIFNVVTISTKRLKIEMVKGWSICNDLTEERSHLYSALYLQFIHMCYF